jgi:hypothetical protein
MRKISALAVSVVLASASLALSVSPAIAAQDAAVQAGKMIYSSDGKTIGAIYAVASDGSPQVIVEGRLVTIPAASVTAANGKISTSLTKKEVVVSR